MHMGLRGCIRGFLVIWGWQRVAARQCRNSIWTPWAVLGASKIRLSRGWWLQRCTLTARQKWNSCHTVQSFGLCEIQWEFLSSSRGIKSTVTYPFSVRDSLLHYKTTPNNPSSTLLLPYILCIQSTCAPQSIFKYPITLDENIQVFIKILLTPYRMASSFWRPYKYSWKPHNIPVR